MKINCKKLKATHQHTTCIARQKKLEKYNAGAGWGNNGMDHYNYSVCDGCEIGLRLLEKDGKK